ncbi:MAG: DUF2569 domain-containing protein [Flavobacteriales bacterium]|nr:DUF2569 domain-containing protein [Flavobacteriales bacterium]
MVLPAIGLILSPFRVMFDLLSDWPDFIYSPVYASYVAVEDPSLYQLYCYFSQAMNIGVLTVCILANLLFWSRRTSLPRIMVLFYAMNFLNLFIDLMAYDFFDLRAVTGEAYGAKDVVRAFIGAAIWIPYFLVSSRVHTTFRKRYDGSFDGQAPGQI